MNIFVTLPSGDSALWLDDPVTLPDGRSVTSADWALQYVLRGPSQLDLTASPASTGGGWATTLTAAASAALQPGMYSWAARVSRGAERITIGAGQLQITADLSTISTSYDGRTVAQRALEACEAALASFKASGGAMKKYEIAGRSMEFHSLAELLQVRSFWAAKVLAEGTAAAVANGQGNPRNLHVRFRRA